MDGAYTHTVTAHNMADSVDKKAEKKRQAEEAKALKAKVGASRM